jgi:hypothetical protein
MWWCAAFAAGALVVALATMWHVRELRTAERLRASNTLQTLAGSLAAQAERALDTAGITISAVINLVGAGELADPELRRRIHLELVELVSRSPIIQSAWVLDGAGNAVAENWSHPMRPGNYAHREYYQGHLDGSRATVVEPLMIGTTTQRPRFTVSRAIRPPDGSLRGVVVVGIFNQYFEDVFSGAVSWASAEGAMRQVDGSLLALVPRPDQPVDAALTSEIAARVQSAARGVDTAETRGEMRLVAWHRSEDGAVLASASVALAEALRPAFWPSVASVRPWRPIASLNSRHFTVRRRSD